MPKKLEEINLNADDSQVLNKLRECYFGIYVMQCSDHVNSRTFRAGALGIKYKDKNSISRRSALTRLRECIAAGTKWKFVFFAKAENNNDLYSAEAILHGKLCEKFRGRSNSRFEAESVDEVKEVAREAVEIFSNASQYNLDLPKAPAPLPAPRR